MWKGRTFLGLDEALAQISYPTSCSYLAEAGSEWKEGGSPSTPPKFLLRPLLKHGINAMPLFGAHKVNGPFHGSIHLPPSHGIPEGCFREPW